MLSKTLIKYSSLFLRDIDKNGIRIFLESSPLYPNLLSVMQTLRYVGLDVQAGQCDREHLKTLVSPVLLHLNRGDKQILVIAKWIPERNCLKILNLKNSRWENQLIEDVAKYWDGIVIYANDRQINNFAGLILLIILSVILCPAISLYHMTYSFNPEILYYIPIILGFTVSISLYFKSHETGNRVIDRLCHISRVADCDRVDDSKYSSIFGFKMNCLALSFFSSQIICVGSGLIFSIGNTLHSLYLIPAVISLPALTYSAYGQFKIKNICPLCIIIALCLAIEAIIFISHPRQPINVKIDALYCGMFAITVALVQYVSNIRQKESKHLTDEIHLLKLKRKKEIIFTESTPADPIFSPVEFGDEKSSTNITTFISPGCLHCRNVISKLITLRQKGLNFRWKIILGETARTDSEIIDIWIRSYLTDKNQFFNDLILWSNNAAQISSPVSSYAEVDEDTSAIRQSFKRQIAYLKISGFPRIILNDRLLSPIYETKDIEFLITDKNII